MHNRDAEAFYCYECEGAALRYNRKPGSPESK